MTYQEKQFDYAKYGWFFAFDEKQFNEQKKEWVEYIEVGGIGLYLPKDKADEILKEANEFNKKEMQRRLKEDWVESIIRYEMKNHEVWFTWDLTDVIETLQPYGITEEQIKEVYKKYYIRTKRLTPINEPNEMYEEDYEQFKKDRKKYKKDIWIVFDSSWEVVCLFDIIYDTYLLLYSCVDNKSIDAIHKYINKDEEYEKFKNDWDFFREAKDADVYTVVYHRKWWVYKVLDLK